MASTANPILTARTVQWSVQDNWSSYPKQWFLDYQENHFEAVAVAIPVE